MDPLFNKLVPQSKPKVFIIRPRGKTFITGLASSYDEDSFDEGILGKNISQREFKKIVEKLNETIIENWPCSTCQLIGYMFCPCTLGLSFIFPGCVISEAKYQLKLAIKDFNEYIFKKMGLFMMYRQYCSTSWLELHVIGKSKEKTQQKQQELIKDKINEPEQTQSRKSQAKTHYTNWNQNQIEMTQKLLGDSYRNDG
eukprot:403342157